jgi:hypothetical protein
MDALRPTHGTYRPVAHEVWRAKYSPTWGRLHGVTFAEVFTSPLQRATRTCELAGFGAVAEIDRDLVEWSYGEYEGRLTTDIHRERLISNCFAMALLEGNRHKMLARGRIAR